MNETKVKLWTTKKISIAKTISYRILSLFTTSIIGYFFTKSMLIGISIGGTEIFVNLALYYFHERAWVMYLKRKNSNGGTHE